MFYALLKVREEKSLPYCIKEFAKQLSKNALQTTKDILKSKPFKNDTKHSTEYWNLKNNQLNPEVSWKSKGDINPAIPFSEAVTHA